MTNVFVYTGVATNVSLELYVASLGSINTENMVSKAIASSTSSNNHLQYPVQTTFFIAILLNFVLCAI